MSTRHTKVYELYEAGSGYTFLEKENPNRDQLLDADAKLIWEVEAASWDEAQATKHEFLGWEPYRPMR